MPRGKNSGNLGANALQNTDLSKLESSSEEDLTTVLKSRYEQDYIYTRIGDQVLVSVNPNKSLSLCSDAHSLDCVAEYKDISGQNAGQLSPHIFQLVNQTYLHMRRTGVDQSIIVRYVINHLKGYFQGPRAKFRVCLRQCGTPANFFFFVIMQWRLWFRQNRCS